MPRQLRPDFSNLVVHAMNRAANRSRLLFTEQDYAAMERVFIEALKRVPIRVLAFCFMSNHFHVVVQPRSTEELSAFMKWFTQVHAHRWRQARDSVGGGAVYQGRYRAFVMSSDEHLLWVCRYVERNAARASLVTQAEDWRWGSLWHRTHGDRHGLLAPSPVPMGQDWTAWVNEPQTPAELEAIRKCIGRERPFGPDDWVRSKAKELGIEHTLRDEGRPRILS